MLQKITRAFVFAGLLLLTTFAITLAWPETAPDRATISGPGLSGEVEITDPAVLNALKLGGVEDFKRGVLAAPKVGEGYRITRYFYQGTFNFGLLHYYRVDGQASYVYFEDGPDLEGNHTMYHQKWFHATPTGDAAMKQFLVSLGVSASETRAQTDPRPSLDLSNPQTQRLVAVGMAAAIVMATFGWVLRRRAGAR